MLAEDFETDDLVMDDLPSLEDVELPQELVYDELSPNLAEDFMAHPDGEAALEEIGRKCYRDFEDAWESLAEHREGFAKNWKFFMCEIPKRGAPFEHSCNIHVPLTLENILRLDLQFQQEIFGDWRSVCRFTPNAQTPAEKEACEALNLHVNWQIREGIKSFQMEMARATLIFLFDGNVIQCAHYNEETRQNEHLTLTPDEFFVPYMTVSTATDLSDVPYYGRILRWFPHQLEAKKGIWTNVDLVLERKPSDATSEPDTVHAASANEAMGVKEGDGETAPYKLIHYEGWLKLPRQERSRFCQVIFDHTSKAILSLKILEENDWRDEQRYNAQLAERAAYEQATAIFQQQMAIGAAMGMQLPMDPPPMPAWMQQSPEPSLPRRVPLYLWSRGILIHNLSGFYGIGMGRIQSDFNRTANILMSQFADSAAMNNAPGIITSNQVTFDGGFSVAPGAINKAALSGGQLKEQIMPFQPGPANPQMVDMVRMVQAWAQSSGQAQDILSGAPGKSGETWRGHSDRLEQAQKPLTVMAQRFTLFLKNVLEVNAKLNSVFLPDEEMLDLMDFRANMMRQVKVGAGLYRKNYKVTLETDLRFAPEAVKIQEAMEMVQLPMAIPALQQNLAFLQEAARRYLIARGLYDLLPFLGPQLPPPQTPLGIPLPPPPGMNDGQPKQTPQGPGRSDGGPPGASPGGGEPDNRPGSGQGP